jgi:hypothetical protein
VQHDGSEEATLTVRKTERSDRSDHLEITSVLKTLDMVGFLTATAKGDGSGRCLNAL